MTQYSDIAHHSLGDLSQTAGFQHVVSFKFISLIQLSLLNSRLIYSTVCLAIPLECLTDLSSVVSPIQIVIFYIPALTCSFCRPPHLSKWQFHYSIAQVNNITIPFLFHYVKCINQSHLIYVQNISGISHLLINSTMITTVQVIITLFALNY